MAECREVLSEQDETLNEEDFFDQSSDDEIVFRATSETQNENKYSGDEACTNTQIEVPFEFVTGKRSDSVLLYTRVEKQLYRKCSKYESKYYSYRCRIKDCKSRVYYEFATEKCVMKTKKFIPHNHGDQQDDYNNLKLLKEMKNECTQLSAVNTRKGSGNCKEIFDRHVARFVLLFFVAFNLNAALKCVPAYF